MNDFDHHMNDFHIWGGVYKFGEISILQISIW